MAGARSESTLAVTAKPGVSKERQLADIALDPLAGGAIVGTTFGKGHFGTTDLGAAYEALSDRAKAIRGNELGSVEDMLTGQAAALHAIFLELTRRSGVNMGEYMQAAEAYMRLALKAQAQCRATLETLATIKNPPVVYARQANIAAGPQQVNNGVGTPRASEPTSPPNGLMELDDGTGERLEPGAQSATIRGDPELEAVGTVERTAHGGWKGSDQPQRRQGRETASSQS